MNFFFTHWFNYKGAALVHSPSHQRAIVAARLVQLAEDKIPQLLQKFNG
jgi:hypothetical protein